MNDARRRLVQTDKPRTFTSEEAAREWQRKRDEEFQKKLRALLNGKQP